MEDGVTGEEPGRNSPEATIAGVREDALEFVHRMDQEIAAWEPPQWQMPMEQAEPRLEHNWEDPAGLRENCQIFVQSTQEQVHRMLLEEAARDERTQGAVNHVLACGSGIGHDAANDVIQAAAASSGLLRPGPACGRDELRKALRTMSLQMFALGSAAMFEGYRRALGAARETALALQEGPDPLGVPFQQDLQKARDLLGTVEQEVRETISTELHRSLMDSAAALRKAKETRGNGPAEAVQTRSEETE